MCMIAIKNLQLGIPKESADVASSINMPWIFFFWPLCHGIDSWLFV